MQQQPYYLQTPAYQPLPPDYPGKKLMIASVVCGSASLALGPVFFAIATMYLAWAIILHPVIGTAIYMLGLSASIVGIVMGIMGDKQARLFGYRSGMATLGLVLSILGLVLGFVFSAFYLLTSLTCYTFYSACNTMSKSYGCSPTYSIGELLTLIQN